MGEDERQKQTKTRDLEAQLLEDDAENADVKQTVSDQISVRGAHEKSLREPRPLPSLVRFYGGNMERFMQASFGYRLSDRLRLLGFAMFQSVPNFARRRVTLLDKSLALAEKRLCRDVIVRIDGSLYAVMDPMGLMIVNQSFEPYIREHLNIGRSGVFVDIGAHVGKYTVLVSKIVGPEGRVIAVEPSSKNFEVLKRNIELNNLGNVVAYNIAAWNKAETLKFFIGDNSAAFSVENRYLRGVVTVQARAVDEIIKELKLNRVDLVKIDVEGAEYDVLLGLERTLRVFRPRVLLEVWRNNVDRVAVFFDRLGYEIKVLSEVMEFNIGKPDYTWVIDVLCSPR